MLVSYAGSTRLVQGDPVPDYNLTSGTCRRMHFRLPVRDTVKNF